MLFKYVCLMKIKDLCEDDRPREKMLANGAGTLSNAELLAILLRTGTGKMNAVEVARMLLKSADDSLGALAGMSVESLCEINGVGPGKAVTVAAAFELGRRCSVDLQSFSRVSVSSPRTVVRIMLPMMLGLDHEECWVLYLNRSNHLIGKERMSLGGLESTVIDNKAIIRRALEKKASGVILVHNHPSGSAMPGQADIQQTASLKRALGICGMSLIDHVVMADGCWYSFADEKLVNEKF